MENIRAHLFVEGRVQGVSYRWWCRSAAQSLGLTGWVKNLEDGRVEAVFEGPEEKIEQMVKECKEGSRVADVDHIEIIREDATGEFEEFEIVYN
ncbi:MAG: acylphosphatase [Candidatus Woesebacteria bacterium]